ncbi:SprT-like domain-containing protein [Natronomonas salsuginis]|uniref:SprT domain-containing protein n=1 Tax=Natronomonas salsuginis TaxID=2217661 RepID=A0A4U5JB32_9EURY|nr:SprT-like domain-containing protein [Natronomonas salsuginis]TKR25481.1 sprT domain-containing protein [Natronomonas salsuginis]
MPVALDYYRITPDATDAEFLAASKLYARAVVDDRDLSVSVSELEWEISKRAKRRAGAVKHRDGVPKTVSLTWGYFETHGWSGVAEIIRHELIHVHLLNTAGDGSHGAAFEALADQLDTRVTCDRFSDPKWWIVCEGCGHKFGRYRRSEVVKSPESYRCGECGGSLRVEAGPDNG